MAFLELLHHFFSLNVPNMQGAILAATYDIVVAFSEGYVTAIIDSLEFGMRERFDDLIVS